MKPPWQAFPTYERYSIGWRMGSGESYLMEYWKFLDELPEDRASRLEYLRSWRPAPFIWADTVHNILHPELAPDRESDEEPDEIEIGPEQLAELESQGLIEVDAAYQTWRAEQDAVTWPWSHSETPEEAARYWTRSLWFTSRLIVELRDQGKLEILEIPEPWKTVESELRTGRLGEVDAGRGLLTLARMMLANDLRPPWQLGLTPADHQESYELDMGFVDAYDLWVHSAFDDDRRLSSLHTETKIPEDWKKWVDGQGYFLIL